MEDMRWLVTHYPRSFQSSIDDWNEIQRILRERFRCMATSTLNMENDLLIPFVRSDDEFSDIDLQEANQLVREFFFNPN